MLRALPPSSRTTRTAHTLGALASEATVQPHHRAHTQRVSGNQFIVEEYGEAAAQRATGPEKGRKGRGTDTNARVDPKGTRTEGGTEEDTHRTETHTYTHTRGLLHTAGRLWRPARLHGAHDVLFPLLSSTARVEIKVHGALLAGVAHDGAG